MQRISSSRSVSLKLGLYLLNYAGVNITFVYPLSIRNFLSRFALSRKLEYAWYASKVLMFSVVTIRAGDFYTNLGIGLTTLFVITSASHTDIKSKYYIFNIRRPFYPQIVIETAKIILANYAFCARRKRKSILTFFAERFLKF